MRFTVLAFFLLTFPCLSQPVPDAAGATQAFSLFVSTVHAGGETNIEDLIACPNYTGVERPVVGPCTMTLAAHRVRVERLTELARVLFPTEPTALNPHYGVEEEGDGVFHLLLFSDLDSADYVMAAFMEVDGTYRLTNLDTEGGPEIEGPPPSVVAAFENLVAAARDIETTVEDFCPLVAARGDDSTRTWQTAADASRPDERRFAGETLEAVRSLVEAGRGDFEIEGYGYETESEGEWHVLHVRFNTPEGDEQVSFAFLPIGEWLLLGDIDR